MGPATPSTGELLTCRLNAPPHVVATTHYVETSAFTEPLAVPYPHPHPVLATVPKLTGDLSIPVDQPQFELAHSLREGIIRKQSRRLTVVSPVPGAVELGRQTERHEAA